jgi:hypothetical protein
MAEVEIRFPVESIVAGKCYVVEIGQVGGGGPRTGR